MDRARDAVPAARPGLLERTFRLAEHGTSVRTEVLAGLTTFLTMAYIVFINPSILGDAGMPRGAVFVATCLVAALGSMIMALWANYPIALAPGMGLNAYFTYVVVQQLGFSWQAALGAVFISGVCFLIVTLTGLRALIVEGIPRSMRIAITVGIGLFLAIIALKNAGLVAASPATFVTLGDLHKPEAILAVLGFLMVAVLSARKVRAALLSSILTVTALSFVFAGNTFQGIVSLPPSIAPTLFALDIPGALSAGLLHVILVLFLVELFDATGTLMGVASRAGLLTDGKMRRLDRALMADSVSVFAGSLLGTSSTTAYLESASGVEEGGRTGLTAATVAVLFLACLFFAPLAGAVPAYATAPALFYVACLMLRELVELDWDDITEVVPACVTALLMPFTYSIATGVSCGFITYAALKLLAGRAREVKPIVWVIAAVFLFKFVETGGAH
ncbi:MULTISPECIES: NCS2 family permease [Methylobacterium]|jgi:adenine/guanine/hypoxanthine permease|uniref:NCS2 family permease n=1 Tax=Methylobacterium TaxID=407 RepID=UPI00036A0AB6|nr:MULTISPECIES: NCS2 family permease [Methylobacterium]MBN4093749.1 NCS2 family permease [Methylobacterium sp. OT2]UIN33803.1 NCS2 family permease [Methylobacterium oryzae]SFE14296.1 putative MFS transporter, AGZA family, xanthine/uracil permease [Methylobacterium sp. 13MFTsu3.1M2]